MAQRPNYAFSPEFLSKKAHANPDLHIIGNDIAPPSVVSNVGTAALGTSPYPAREDHVHNIPAGYITEAMLSTATGELGAAWVSYTPTFGGTTLGNGNVFGRYFTIGKTTIFQALFGLGSTSAMTGPLTVTLPITANASILEESVQVQYYDASAGFRYKGICASITTTTATISAIGTAGNYAISAAISNVVPFTWAQTDEVRVFGTYEAN